MTVILNSEKVTSAFVALLRSQLANPLGDNSTDGISTVGAYHVLYRIPDGSASGSFGDPHQDLVLVFQITTVGRSRAQCEGLAWIASNVVVEMSPSGGHVHPLSGPGWRGGLRTQQTFDAPHDEGTDETGKRAWAQRERFEVQVHRA